LSAHGERAYIVVVRFASAGRASASPDLEATPIDAPTRSALFFAARIDGARGGIANARQREFR
jgi:hypothetical protein